MLSNASRNEHWFAVQLSPTCPTIPCAFRSPLQYLLGAPYASALCVRCLLWSLTTKRGQPCSRTDGSVAAAGGRGSCTDEHLVDTNFGLLKCRSVRRKSPEEQWSRREKGEARGTKWNFDVGMDAGANPTVPPPAPPPRHDSQESDLRGSVHAKALRIRAFLSAAGLLDALHVRGSHTLVNAEHIMMPRMRAAEPQQRRRRNVELLQIQVHDRWTLAEVRWILSRRGQKRPQRQTTRTWQIGWMRTTSEGDQRPLTQWNQSTMKTCQRSPGTQNFSRYLQTCCDAVDRTEEVEFARRSNRVRPSSTRTVQSRETGSSVSDEMFVIETRVANTCRFDTRQEGAEMLERNT